MEEEDSWQEDQSMLDEESSYEDDQWSNDGSNTDFEEDPYEEDPEPVPPDPYQDEDISTDWSRKEPESEGYESGSWQEETEVKSCLEKPEDWDHEADEDTQSQYDAKEDSWEALTHTDPDQDIEERPWTEVPYSDPEARQALPLNSYHENGSWWEEIDSPISEDEAREYGHDFEGQRSQYGLTEEEEALSETGRNVQEIQLTLAEEEEVESEAGRNISELKKHSINFSGYGQRDEEYLEWEDEMETLFQSHHVPEEEKLSYATKTLTGPALYWWNKEQYTVWYYQEPEHTWESFKSEMLKGFVKKISEQEYQSPESVVHSGYTPTSTQSFKAGSKQAHHSPQKIKPAVEKKTIKKQEGSQLSSLQLLKVPETSTYPKGTLTPGRKKAGFVLEKTEPQAEDEAMVQDGRPKNAEKVQESQKQHLSCPQNVEEDVRSIKRTHAPKEQIILQLAETIWIISFQTQI
ncbi:unnamed protein product [Eruca vesicaria subsp. sativa]|uniref:Uncharacterized protein n=1 Tax=Eruca vesicaria subsp. sativa TaxID=29727 RepID=A0ABC8M059_ERUVS|nr:unnamed protein product [Eruca vesicaria subsp. sativa]